MEPYQSRKRQYRSWIRSLSAPIPRSTHHRYLQRSEAVNNNPVNTLDDGHICPSHDLNNDVDNTEPIEDVEFLSQDEVMLDSQCESGADVGSENFNSGHSSLDLSQTQQTESINNSDVNGESSSPEDDGSADNDSSPENNHSDNDPPLNNIGPKRLSNLDVNLPNLEITKFECMLMVLNFSFRHNLTAVATEDLFKLINCILGAEYLPTSKYMLRKVFGGVQYSYHFYCSHCEHYLGEFNKNEKFTLQCSVCYKECDLQKMNGGHFFVTLPVKEQLTFLLENTDNIREFLNYRWTRATDENTIADIYDGKMYKNLCKEGNILSNRDNLSVTFNTDGAAVFDACKNTLWPIHFRINELPPFMRFDQGNSMVAGLWFGKREPNMPVFLTPFLQEMKKLYDTGFQWHDPESGIVCTSKVVLLNCVVDSAAKPAVQNIKKFNGYYGCGYCVHPGIVLEGCSNLVKYSMNEDVFLMDDYSSSYTVTRTNPKSLQEEVVSVEDRNNAQMREDMKLAEERRLHQSKDWDVKGAKGMSALCALPHFDVVNGFAIDYMHCVLLGVVRLVTDLWLSSSSSCQGYYIKTDIPKIDQRLLKICPPTSISRRPRSIEERIHWKANEWRSWLLFYSLPCLVGTTLPSRYIKHHCLLVTASYTLLKDQITLEELDSASWHLIEYVIGFLKLYGPSYMYYNVHLLLHLSKCVCLMGPLWCYSAFSFETSNGCLMKLVKGTRGVVSQIDEKYSMCKVIPQTLKLYRISDRVLDFCKDLMCYRTSAMVTKLRGVTLLGAQKSSPLSSEEKSAFLQGGYPLNCCLYERFLKKNILFTSRCYARQGAKSNDSVVKLVSGSFAYIERIVVLPSNEGSTDSVYILVRNISVQKNESIVTHPTGAKASHIVLCSPVVYGMLSVHNTDEIDAKAIFLHLEEESYITLFPNNYEKD